MSKYWTQYRQNTFLRWTRYDVSYLVKMPIRGVLSLGVKDFRQWAAEDKLITPLADIAAGYRDYTTKGGIVRRVWFHIPVFGIVKLKHTDVYYPSDLPLIEPVTEHEILPVFATLGAQLVLPPFVRERVVSGFLPMSTGLRNFSLHLLGNAMRNR